MNELKFEKELWEQAQRFAEIRYNKEFGNGAWDEADKYEREDWAFAEYDDLEKQRKAVEKFKKDMEKTNFNIRNNMEKMNFNKGNNETTNKTNNVKENDIMMNRNNAKENRMETLKANGVNTDNFFDLSMRIPFGAEVKIMVDGKEMVIPATNNGTNLGTGLVNEFVDICNMANDAIAQGIINDGYVKNSKLFRRWVTAQTFKLLGYVDRKNPNRKGWEAGFKDLYSYGYQFDMMADELHTLAKLQKEDPEYFAERTRFFNGDVAVTLLNDYLYRLKKYVKKQLRTNPKKYRGEAYVKLAKYGNVLVKDLDSKVYNLINTEIKIVKIAVDSGNYADIEKRFRRFVNNYYNKLPYDTTKCAAFKDAYKGIGAFETLKNLIRFHNVVLDGCKNKYDSERELYRTLDNTPNSDVWVFHNLLVSTIEINKFDLKQSIAYGNAAPNTVSSKADRYRR